MSDMLVDRDKLAIELHNIVSTTRDRATSLQEIAELLRSSGSYRWVGLYDVDRAAGIVTNIVWSGPGAPEYATFPITKGLTGAAISGRKTVNVGDVAADPRYLTAFRTTRSEIIVPVLDWAAENVVGTIDVESERPNAFSEEVQALLGACSDMIRPLWRRESGFRFEPPRDNSRIVGNPFPNRIMEEFAGNRPRLITSANRSGT